MLIVDHVNKSSPEAGIGSKKLETFTQSSWHKYQSDALFALAFSLMIRNHGNHNRLSLISLISKFTFL